MVNKDRTDLWSYSPSNDVRKMSFSFAVSYANISKGETPAEHAVTKGQTECAMAEGRGVENSFRHQLQSVEKVNVIAQINLAFCLKPIIHGG